MEFVYVLIAVVAIVAVYFLFVRKSAPAVEARPEERQVPAPRAERTEKAKSAAAPPAAASQDASPPPPPSRKARDSVPAPRPVEIAPVVSQPPPGEREVLVEGMRRGLSKSRESEGFFGRLKALLGGKREI